MLVNEARWPPCERHICSASACVAWAVYSVNTPPVTLDWRVTFCGPRTLHMKGKRVMQGSSDQPHAPSYSAL
jgi:hypothetical protein